MKTDPFEAAWRDAPADARVEWPPVDVNRALAAAGRPVAMTRWMLWDAEIRKARAPHVYLPSRFQRSRIWDVRTSPDGSQGFVRASVQRSWRPEGGMVTLVEAVSIDPIRQRIVFRSLRSAVDDTGQTVVATPTEPEFLVVHEVAGTDDHPEIHWRVVRSSPGDDRSWVAPGVGDAAPTVPEFVDVYLAERLRPPARSPATVADAHETVADAVQWTRPFGPHGPEMATLWGDPTRGPHGSLLRFAPGTVSGRHVHPHDSWGVVVQGELVHTYDGQAPGAPLGVGSWYFEPAGVPHVSACSDASACVVMVHNPGPFGYTPMPLPADEGR